ncbi:hypothetical protein [Burkholderia sp. Ac-20365]|uniref:DUF7682 family zinc-binding protein n=1 Tax=Burkholderia sp. Ac-20365 TaxID=2703897 RepID=UPI00197B8B07|nr:hypothetical protein [Burkholderia sp. Ac-20365]MBN3761248.1 hypothetical protein [Burkholderia sp. Ac-20365]
MKRSFPCGHTGKGKYCHRCDSVSRAEAKAEEQAKAEAAARIQARADAQAQEAADRLQRRDRLRQLVDEASIDLGPVEHLPAVCERAATVLEQLAAGVHPYELKAKPLRSTKHTVLSIPVGLSYRLLVERDSRRPLRIVSHEAYNDLYCKAERAAAC